MPANTKPKKLKTSDHGDKLASKRDPSQNGAQPAAEKKRKADDTKPAAAHKPEAAAATEGKKKKSKSEIDDLFGQLKEKPKQQAAAAEEEQDKKLKRGDTKESTKVAGSKDDIFGTEAGKGRKRTEEGYAMYTEEELGLGKRGGDTPLCPFDCDCCY